MQSKIEIDFYKGAFGPTLRIYTAAENDLKRLQHIYQRLANRQINEFIAIAKESSIFNLIGISSLELFVADCDNRLDKSVTIIEMEEFESPKIVWKNTPSGWKKCYGLIDGMLAAAKPCHQYLSDECIDDVIVEVSYLE